MAMGLGIDIGTAQVVIATSAGDVALREPSVIAAFNGVKRVKLVRAVDKQSIFFKRTAKRIAFNGKFTVGHEH